MTESCTSQIWLEVKENCKRKFLLSNSPIIWPGMQGEQHNFMPIQQQSLDRFIFKVYLCWSLFVLKDQVILMVTNSSIPTTLLWICIYDISLSSEDKTVVNSRRKLKMYHCIMYFRFQHIHYVILVSRSQFIQNNFVMSHILYFCT